MKCDALKVNNKIELKILGKNFDETYQTKIADIDELRIKVLVPSYKGEIVAFRRGIKIDALVVDDNTAYKFRSIIVNREKKNVPLLTLQMPESIQKIQRRKYFRLRTSLEAKYLSSNKSLEKLKEARVQDISGGGVKLALGEKVPVRTLVGLRLDIPEIKDVPIIGKVVRSYDNNHHHSIGVKFLDLKEPIQDKIIKWIFKEQRKLRKKGLLSKV